MCACRWMWTRWGSYDRLRQGARMMPQDSLYDTDILTWSTTQAERLRRVAAGERVNDVDWTNVIEEIESVGKSQSRSVLSHLRMTLLHALKLTAWPDHRDAPHWQIELVT